MSDNKIINIVVFVGIFTVLGFGAVAIGQATINTVQEMEKREQEEKKKDEEAIVSISKVQTFENQEIKKIEGSKVTLANGTEFEVQGTIPCNVGDIIQDYDKEKDAVRCLAKQADGNTEIRYIPTSSSPSILEYALAWSLLTNNGFSYDRETHVYHHSSGRTYEVDKSQGGKPSVKPKASSDSNTSNNSLRSSKPVNSGHGGVSSGGDSTGSS